MNTFIRYQSVYKYSTQTNIVSFFIFNPSLLTMDTLSLVSLNENQYICIKIHAQHVNDEVVVSFSFGTTLKGVDLFVGFIIYGLTTNLY